MCAIKFNSCFFGARVAVFLLCRMCFCVILLGLTDHKHSFGHINIMQIIHPQKKGRHLNTIERFHIYKEAHKGNHLNDDLTVAPTNKIFDTITTQENLIT